MLVMTTTSESNPGVVPTTAEDVPGGPKTLTSKVIGTAAGMVQDLTPVKQFQEVGHVSSCICSPMSSCFYTHFCRKARHDVFGYACSTICSVNHQRELC